MSKSRKLPLQNRVDPFGKLVSEPARGAMMGNRGGRFHRPDQTLGKRRWASRQWICCNLNFKERKRSVWGNSYTELFFLDEVVALSAGHRPCAECRRAAFNAFKAATGLARASEMDSILHPQRLALHRPVYRAIDDLPDGAVVGSNGFAYVRRQNAYFCFQSSAWVACEKPLGQVDVLTPALNLKALTGGYSPLWHESASI